MTIEQAIQILTVATANLQATREQHSQIVQAIQLLQTLIPKKEGE